MDHEDESLFTEMLGHMSPAEIEALAAMELGSSDAPTAKKKAKKTVTKKKKTDTKKPASSPKVKKTKVAGEASSSSPTVTPTKTAKPAEVDKQEEDGDDDGDDDGSSSSTESIEDLPEADRVPLYHNPTTATNTRRWAGTYTNLKDVFLGIVPADAWASGSAEMVSEALANLSIVNLTNHYSLPDTDLLMCLGKVTHLYLQGNKCIVDLSGLIVLGSLRVLSVADNKITSLEPLSTLDTLILLDASNNEIEELDVGRDLPASLQSVDLRGNPCAPLYDAPDTADDDIEYMLQYTDQLQTFCPKLRFIDGKEVAASSSVDGGDMDDGGIDIGFLHNSVLNAAQQQQDDTEVDPEMVESMRGGSGEEDNNDGHVQSGAMARRQKQLLGELLSGVSKRVGGTTATTTANHPTHYLPPDREANDSDESSGDDYDANVPAGETKASAALRHQAKLDDAEEEDMGQYQQRCGRVRRELDILQSHNGKAARLHLDNFWETTMKSIVQLRGQAASRKPHTTSDYHHTKPKTSSSGQSGSGLNATPPGSPLRPSAGGAVVLGKPSSAASSSTPSSEPSAMYKRALEMLTKEAGGASKLEGLRKQRDGDAPSSTTTYSTSR